LFDATGLKFHSGNGWIPGRFGRVFLIFETEMKTNGKIKNNKDPTTKTQTLMPHVEIGYTWMEILKSLLATGIIIAIIVFVSRVYFKKCNTLKFCKLLRERIFNNQLQ
jgi:hypothetical protein